MENSSKEQQNQLRSVKIRHCRTIC